jgi:hypothetical protein
MKKYLTKRNAGVAVAVVAAVLTTLAQFGVLPADAGVLAGKVAATLLGAL